ncbi:MAG: hypothetical protein P1V51_17465 [Deltaproteobacteria bacterium]|nr:hypothetical protein [Deltaproteobacteria bacterium]
MILALGLSACPGRPGAEEPPAPAVEPAAPAAGSGEGEVLARVNGRPITRAELDFTLRRNPLTRGRSLSAEQERNLLEVLVEQEILAQEAEARGLDRDERIARQLEQKEAELADLRRRLLARELRGRLGAEAPRVSDDEVRQYHEAKRAQLAQRYHVQQILRRSEAELDALWGRIEAGEDFESLAAEGTPEALPAGGRRPWDLGFLRWTQLPEPWRPVLEGLEPGQVGRASGGEGRHWLFRLVAREPEPESSLETLRPALRADLERQAMARAKEEAEAALRARAEVVY